MRKLKKLLNPDCIMAMFAASMSVLTIGFVIGCLFLLYNGCTSCTPTRYGCSNTIGMAGYYPTTSKSFKH